MLDAAPVMVNWDCVCLSLEGRGIEYDIPSRMCSLSLRQTPPSPPKIFLGGEGWDEGESAC